MKKLSILFLSVSFLWNCSGSGDGNEKENSTPTNSCSNVNGLQVSQNGELLNFKIESNQPGPYEITFGQTEIFSLQGASGFVVNEKEFSRSINNLNGQFLQADRSYTFAVRRYCSSSSKSDWGFERNLTISDNYCKTPYELKVEDYIYNQIEWKISTSLGGYMPAKYQVQYGAQGFSLGNGTTVETTNNTYNAPFVSGNTYDIYVRAFCSGSLGWGNWIGPVSFTASNTTACVAPAFANYTIASSSQYSFTPNVTWDNDGVSQYEYSISTSSGLPTPATTNVAQALGGITFVNLNKASIYYFYVRKKCSGNTFSPYFGPYIVKYN